MILAARVVTITQQIKHSNNEGCHNIVVVFTSALPEFVLLWGNPLEEEIIDTQVQTKESSSLIAVDGEFYDTFIVATWYSMYSYLYHLRVLYCYYLQQNSTVCTCRYKYAQHEHWCQVRWFTTSRLLYEHFENDTSYQQIRVHIGTLFLSH